MITKSLILTCKFKDSLGKADLDKGNSDKDKLSVGEYAKRKYYNEWNQCFYASRNWDECLISWW